MTNEHPPLPESEVERAEVLKLLEELGDDQLAASNRVAACEAVAAGLGALGRILWIGGSLIGPDPVKKEIAVRIRR